MELMEDCLRVKKMAIPYFFLLLAVAMVRTCTIWVVVGNIGLCLLRATTKPTFSTLAMVKSS